MNFEEKSAYRLANIGYVFQDFRLFENESIVDNLILPLETMSDGTKTIKEDTSIIYYHLSVFQKKLRARSIPYRAEKSKGWLSRVP